VNELYLHDINDIILVAVVVFTKYKLYTHFSTIKIMIITKSLKDREK
jgi:hypothetical protein